MSTLTGQEVAARLGEEGLVLLDVRTRGEFEGTAGYPCDPRQGHIPGALHLELQDLFATDPAGFRTVLGAPEDVLVVAYCHSGGRSAMACEVLAAAGYEASNFVGSWHEWSADASLPIEPARVLPGG